MWQTIRSDPFALLAAIFVHALLIVLLTFSMDWSSEPPKQRLDLNAVQATVLDETKVMVAVKQIKADAIKKQQDKEKEIHRLRVETEKLRNEQKVRQKRLAKLKKQEDQKRKQEKNDRKRREKDKRDLERIKQEKRKATAELVKAKKKKAELDRKHKADQKKRKAKAKKLAKEKERQKQAAAQKLKDAEAKRAADLRKRKQQQIEDNLEKELQKETMATVNRYYAIIQQRVKRNWRRPASTKKGMSCTIQVRLIPGGDVVNVGVVKTSGDVAFDRSVEAAVYKASPLPLPPDQELFDHFRDLHFRFVPP